MHENADQPAKSIHKSWIQTASRMVEEGAIGVPDQGDDPTDAAIVMN
jgi:hypothetical protein